MRWFKTDVVSIFWWPWYSLNISNNVGQQICPTLLTHFFYSLDSLSQQFCWELWGFNFEIIFFSFDFSLSIVAVDSFVCFANHVWLHVNCPTPKPNVRTIYTPWTYIFHICTIILRLLCSRLSIFSQWMRFLFCSFYFHVGWRQFDHS